MQYDCKVQSTFREDDDVAINRRRETIFCVFSTCVFFLGGGRGDTCADVVPRRWDAVPLGRLIPIRLLARDPRIILPMLKLLVSLLHLHKRRVRSADG